MKISPPKRIALIGGAGFIGHHLALSLADKGHEVSIVDSLMVNNLYAIHAGPAADPRYRPFLTERRRLLIERGIDTIVSDACDYHQLSRILGAIQPHIIVHLAAVAHIDRANKDPWSTFRHSLQTLENAIDVAASIKVEQFVFLSSSTVYGDFKSQIVDESTACKPKGIYGALKLSAEMILTEYGRLKDVPYTIIRPMAAYGPRCISGRVIQQFIEGSLDGRTLELRAGAGERIDFTHVADIVAGIEATLGNGLALGEIFNITAGQGRTLEELVAAIAKLVPDVAVAHFSRDDERPVRGTLAITKARTRLGYAPRWQLAEGVADYVAWYRSINWGVQDADARQTQAAEG